MNLKHRIQNIFSFSLVYTIKYKQKGKNDYKKWKRLKKEKQKKKGASDR